MLTAVLILVSICILLLIFVIVMLYFRNPLRGTNAVQEMLRRMQKEEQRRKREPDNSCRPL